MEERPVKGPYEDLIRYGRRDAGDGRRGKDGKFPGGKECPPYLYAGGDYRPVYSATKDAWELVLENMPKEEQEGSTEEKCTDSEEESMRGDGRCVEALRSRKEARKEAKRREKKEETDRNKKKKQTEAEESKEEDGTQMSGVTEKRGGRRRTERNDR